MSEDLTIRAACDRAVEGAAESMFAGGAPIEMIIDRLLTYAIAQAANLAGSSDTAKMLRGVADKVDGGAFRAITGEQLKH